MPSQHRQSLGPMDNALLDVCSHPMRHECLDADAVTPPSVQADNKQGICRTECAQHPPTPWSGSTLNRAVCARHKLGLPAAIKYCSGTELLKEQQMNRHHAKSRVLGKLLHTHTATRHCWAEAASEPSTRPQHGHCNKPRSPGAHTCCGPAGEQAQQCRKTTWVSQRPAHDRMQQIGTDTCIHGPEQLQCGFVTPLHAAVCTPIHPHTYTHIQGTHTTRAEQACGCLESSHAGPLKRLQPWQQARCPPPPPQNRERHAGHTTEQAMQATCASLPLKSKAATSQGDGTHNTACQGSRTEQLALPSVTEQSTTTACPSQLQQKHACPPLC